MKKKFELPSYEILKTEDDRNEIPTFDRGVFFVHKKNMIAQFSFGGSGTFKNGIEAHEALVEYLSKRKDSEDLNVTLIDRR